MPDRVLGLIDEELARLAQKDDLWAAGRFNFLRRRWISGVYTAREVAARELQKIRDAYVADQLTQEAEHLDLYNEGKGGAG